MFTGISQAKFKKIIISCISAIFPLTKKYNPDILLAGAREALTFPHRFCCSWEILARGAEGAPRVFFVAVGNYWYVEQRAPRVPFFVREEEKEMLMSYVIIMRES